MRSLTILISIALSSIAMAASAPDTQDAQEALSELVDEVRSLYFPDLAGHRIQLKSFDSEFDFFEARVSSGSFWKSSKNRKYIIRFNPSIFLNPPETSALRAIIAHELTHIRYYTMLSGVELLGLMIRYLSSPSFVNRFERATDLQVLELGLSLGLRDYRVWLYDQLPPDALELKRKRYLTPEEIDAWRERNP